MKLRLLVSLAATALAVFAGDVNGKWSATMEGRNGQTREMTYNFKTDGGKTTGTVMSPQGERELENVKVDGDAVSWSQTMNFGGESRTMTYAGKMEGEEIKVTMKAGEMTRDFVMKRAK
ncbi:MAG: hypothetical protein H7039_22300 [Bryobacteraceae bacterium]|nr:hypothetical protein [Bryobacteraceae bacterium]